MAEAQDLKNLLLETNDEYRQLASQHHELDDRLLELESKHYLSDAEQFEEVTLKKRKLHLKDQMEAILRDAPSGSRARGTSLTPKRHGCHHIWATSRGGPSLVQGSRRFLPYDRDQMFIDRAGLPFIVIALVLAGLAAWGGGRAGPCRSWCSPPSSCSSSAIRTARLRPIPTSWSSPADGRVMMAGVEPGPGAPQGEWRQISIFLSPDGRPRQPHAGRGDGDACGVSSREVPARLQGRGRAAERVDRGVVRTQGRAVVCRQIVGILARRIVCRLKSGDTVARGQRFGVMKFGSRIDLFVPTDARILVKAGDRVVAGETVLAQVP